MPVVAPPHPAKSAALTHAPTMLLLETCTSSAYSLTCTARISNKRPRLTGRRQEPGRAFLLVLSREPLGSKHNVEPLQPCRRGGAFPLKGNRRAQPRRCSR